MLFEKLHAIQIAAGGRRRDFKASVNDGVLRIAVDRPSGGFALLDAVSRVLGGIGSNLAGTLGCDSCGDGSVVEFHLDGENDLRGVLSC